MRNYFLYLFLLLLFSSAVQAQTDLDIIRLTFNGQFNAADSILESRIQMAPDNPKNYYLKQQLYYYSRYFRSTDLTNDSLLALVSQNALQTIRLTDHSDLTTEEKFYAGRSYDFLSRTQIYTSRWDAFWSARSARNLLEEVIEENPGYYDAYVSLAVPIYFTSRLSSFMRAVAWMTGMGADRERALEYFILSAQKGRLCKTEALFALAAINRFFENNFQIALDYSNEFLAVHPNNFFILNQRQQLVFLVLIEEKGVQELQTEFDSLRTRYNITNAGILNQLGYMYVNRNEFENALLVFKINMELFPDVANCYDSYAEAHMLAGDNVNAIRYYKIAFSKLDSDPTISDEFRQQLNNGIREKLTELGAGSDI